MVKRKNGIATCAQVMPDGWSYYVTLRRINNVQWREAGTHFFRLSLFLPDRTKELLLAIVRDVEQRLMDPWNPNVSKRRRPSSPRETARHRRSL